MAEIEGSPEQRGTTTIADSVVAKTAGMAAREVPGVHAMGSGTAQRIGAMRQAMGGGTAATSGVSVEVGTTETAVDLVIVVDYGERIHKVAQKVREHVITAVERTTGMDVVEVNISVNDIYIEGDDDEDSDNRPTSPSGRSLD
ncbi:Asp23/Gls24 family envelope stress response protein [Streptomyces sp. ACA25]|uniref:Asp23/Gls24 family envelope stress response protein n=1 Tax=Streptomyces sp. ACA25 TaxID=3022596 RepID=UPI002307DD4B|nr:Asp23/Gls24 family envelope stress response protein [Streptomyces sp. ACA25]MDB1087404.1 Asp23/Gls24 family envelope stress response protein [Streptomyces sp. ACA25]